MKDVTQVASNPPAETAKKRVYTEFDKRRALAASYRILNTKANHSRYAMTRFGVSMDRCDQDDGLYFPDVLECLAILHNDMCVKEKEIRTSLHLLENDP